MSEVISIYTSNYYNFCSSPKIYRSSQTLVKLFHGLIHGLDMVELLLDVVIVKLIRWQKQHLVKVLHLDAQRLGEFLRVFGLSYYLRLTTNELQNMTYYLLRITHYLLHTTYYLLRTSSILIVLDKRFRVPRPVYVRATLLQHLHTCCLHAIMSEATSL